MYCSNIVFLKNIKKFCILEMVFYTQAKVDSFLENSQNGIFLELFYIKKQQKINPLTSARICRKCYIFLKLFFGT